MEREPPAHGRGVYWLLAALAALAAACGGAPDESGGASEGLVFVRRVGASSELARARLADRAVRAVTATPEREEAWPHWSGVARRVVFEAARPEPGALSNLVLWDPATAIETPLAASPRRDERWPDWAPARSALAFAFRGGDPPSGLAVFDLVSGRATVVARGGVRDFFLRPSWSSAGAIVAQRRAPGGGGSRLWIVRPGAKPRALTSDPAWFDSKPSFTRDGREIVFSRRPAAGGRWRIAAVAVRSGAVRELELGLPDGADLHSPQPSPERDELVFVAQHDGVAEIFLADRTGGEARALTRGAERQAFAPRWSPDGERIAAMAMPAGTSMPRLKDHEAFGGTSVLVIDREGRVLFETPGMMADWMPPWR